MKINFKVRFKNPIFVVQLLLAILTPMFAYAGLTFQDMNSWTDLGKLIVNAISSPYVLSLIITAVWNALNDPTTAGVFDSQQAMTYIVPKKSISTQEGENNE